MKMFSKASILKKTVCVAMTCVALGWATPASADWLFTPFAGVVFGNSADFGDVGDFKDNLEKRVTFGGSLSWMGGGVFGFEADLGSTPNFFQTTTGSGDFEFGDSNVTTLMGNLIIGAPGTGFRPYASAGLGLLRTNVKATRLFNDLSQNELGFNVGAGAHGFFSDNLGLRADIRYFRDLTKGDDGGADLDVGDLRFWRGTLGLTFRFGG